MPDVDTHNRPSVDYEKRDVAAGAIAACGLGLALVVLLTLGVSAGIFRYFREKQAGEDMPLAPLAAKERLRLPRDLAKIPPPRLQTAESADQERSQQADEDVLRSYGWVDRQAGIVRIPIAEAMRMLSDPDTAKAKGLRSRPNKGAP